MKNSTFKWLWRVTGKKKRCVALLILAQGINGCSGVLYALLLQQMVDRAVGHDRNGFLLFAGLLLLLVAGQIAIRGLIREELRNLDLTTEKSQQAQAGDMDENVLGFLLALQQEGDEIT